ncbi:class I SAM-dependent methyltransferase [Arenimonas daejeonensis]|uniref:class I SAM-dependent methyltransferase n=1 Tax=Arenimonas daejeonensis TaxID=370777 RepID=UPI001D15E3C3|nr:class I SAM-dependent methyltransferase [Arenimonas daejeonensis]
MPRDRLIHSWTANAAAWTAAVRGGRIESRRLVTDSAIVAAVTALAPRRVLDVGCGEGWLCRALMTQGVEAVGIDVSAPLVEAARAAGPGRYEVMAYEELRDAPVRIGTFDAVVCNFALLDQDIVPMLADLRALLAPGGRLLVQTVHPGAPAATSPIATAGGWRPSPASATRCSRSRCPGISAPWPRGWRRWRQAGSPRSRWPNRPIPTRRARCPCCWSPRRPSEPCHRPAPGCASIQPERPMIRTGPGEPR